MIWEGDFDCALVSQQRTGCLEPDQRRPERRPFHFRDVVGIIQTDRDQLRWRHRHTDFNPIEFRRQTARFRADPKWLFQTADFVAYDFAVEKLSVGLKSAKSAHEFEPTA